MIHTNKISVRDKIRLIREQLAADGRVSFAAMIGECRSRMEIIVSFMAVLELIKSRVLDALQDAAFGDIVLVPTERRVGSARRLGATGNRRLRRLRGCVRRPARSAASAAAEPGRRRSFASLRMTGCARELTADRWLESDNTPTQ